MPSNHAPEEPGGRCRMSRAQLLLNALAALAALAVAAENAQVRRYEAAVLACIPALACVWSLIAGRGVGPRWVLTVALLTNVAAGVLLCVLGAEAGMAVGGSLWLAALDATGAVVCAWNVVCLSAPAPES